MLKPRCINGRIKEMGAGRIRLHKLHICTMPNSSPKEAIMFMYHMFQRTYLDFFFFFLTSVVLRKCDRDPLAIPYGFPYPHTLFSFFATVYLAITNLAITYGSKAGHIHTPASTVQDFAAKYYLTHTNPSCYNERG